MGLRPTGTDEEHARRVVACEYRANGGVFFRGAGGGWRLFSGENIEMLLFLYAADHGLNSEIVPAGPVENGRELRNSCGRWSSIVAPGVPSAEAITIKGPSHDRCITNQPVFPMCWRAFPRLNRQ